MEDIREVRFDEYCKKCEHEKKQENETPCDKCLDEPVNDNTSKPKMFKEKEARRNAISNNNTGTDNS